MRVLAVAYLLGSVGWANPLAANHEFFYLAVSRGPQAFPKAIFPPLQLKVASAQIPGLAQQVLRVRTRYATHDLLNGKLELVPALGVSFQDAEAQRLKPLVDLIAKDAQSLTGMGSHQNSLTLFQEVPDEVRNRVRLAGPRRPLHQHGICLAQALGDLQLLLVGRFAEQNVAPGGTRSALAIAYDPWWGRLVRGDRPTAIAARYLDENSGDVGRIASEVFDYGCDDGMEPSGSRSHKDYRIAPDNGMHPRVTLRVTEFSILGEQPLNQLLEEPRGPLAAERDHTLHFEFLGQSDRDRAVESRGKRKQGTMYLGVVNRRPEPKLGCRRVEFHPDSLKQDRVLDSRFFARLS